MGFGPDVGKPKHPAAVFVSALHDLDRARREVKVAAENLERAEKAHAVAQAEIFRLGHAEYAVGDVVVRVSGVPPRVEYGKPERVLP